jgi:crossover junction endodeoxyribonuclease RusA
VTAFFVPGIPAPQGSKTFKGFRGGKPILAESSAKVKPWRTLVTTFAHEHGQRIDGPCHVMLAFNLPRPASVSVKRRPHPCVKPDLDKLIRSTLDGLTDSGIFTDDSQVVVLSATKRYALNGDGPGCWVSVEAVS